ncbi:hypothetical protein FOZ62_028454, partial [Perkinsus olseni]
TAQSGPKVAQPVTLPPKAVLPPPRPRSHGERGLAQSLPPPVNRGLGVQASERIPVGGLGPQAWRVPMPRLELGAPRLSFHPSAAVVPLLAGAPPPPMAGRIIGRSGPPPTTGGGGFEGARIRSVSLNPSYHTMPSSGPQVVSQPLPGLQMPFSWRPSQIGGAPAGSSAHHLRPIVPGFPLKA